MLSRWGVETRSDASGKECGAPFFGVFFVLFSGTKNTPDPLVRRVANILNKHTIHLIVSNLLTTC